MLHESNATTLPMVYIQGTRFAADGPNYYVRRRQLWLSVMQGSRRHFRCFIGRCIFVWRDFENSRGGAYHLALGADRHRFACGLDGFVLLENFIRSGLVDLRSFVVGIRPVVRWGMPYTRTTFWSNQPFLTAESPQRNNYPISLEHNLFCFVF